ncbi:claudin-17 [Phascolarctos cinereus]|uniref:Claudin n=1 Tax=Phascolarctos cinereus TaxID=38626 RepID=A0A6P5L4K5_PHACI|nr:claudin-17 [Phascolarctos cinereus]
MALYPLQIAGLVLGFLGVIGTLATTLLPQWRVSAFIGSNIVIFERIWEGLWMTCVQQAHVRWQCKYYGSLLALPPALETSRALMCVAIALSLIALFVGIFSTKQARCTGSNEQVKSYLLGASGVLFILTGIIILIPLCWTANLIIQDFYNPTIHVGQKRELGAALFLGWTTSAVFFIGGVLLCSVYFCKRRRRRHRCSSTEHRVQCKPQHQKMMASKTSTSYV